MAGHEIPGVSNIETTIAADLDGDGLLSLIAPGKDGLVLYRNRGTC